MRILTSHDIRKMCDYLVDSGIDCFVQTGEDNAVIVNLVRGDDYADAKHSWFDVACHIIRDVIDGVGIRFMSSASDDTATVKVGF